MSSPKVKTSFFCQNCGFESPKWAGKCPSCNEWNTFVEEKVIPKSKVKTKEEWWTEDSAHAIRALNIETLEASEEDRLLFDDEEINRCLGGGLVLGSITLVAGEPGIGKSTLFLQSALSWKQKRTLYISGEESAHQIKMRAQRLGLHNDNVFLLIATDTQVIFQEIKKLQPDWVIVDSIQTMATPFIESAPGSVSQLRECTAEFQKFAKQTNTPVCLIGHITKDGSIAGPKVLEHMVDTVLQFEGDRHFAYRILRTLKNRFGSTAELAIYEMASAGMRPVRNPSEVLLTQHDSGLSGIAIASTLEGSRPLMIEVQALVSSAVYGTPQRTTNGFDIRRLQLLLAVLEKRGGFHFGMKDVFLNIAGGLKIEDPAIDLPIVCALLSSFEDKPLAPRICLIGEIGLSGEIRAVNRIEQRILEAEKLGMEKVYLPLANAKSVDVNSYNIEIVFVQKLAEIYQALF